MMGESVNSMTRAVRRPLWLAPFLLLCVVPAPPVLAMELGAIMRAFMGSQHSQPCPPPCQCGTLHAQDLMQEQLTNYLPSMAAHMDPLLEPELRSTVAVMTSWLGNMADLQCRLPDPGDRINLTEVLQASTLSFKAVHISCPSGGSVVWDVSPFDAFLTVLHLSGCVLEKAADQQKVVLPPNLWVLDLQGLPAETVTSLDFSQASQLRTFSFTHSNLSSLPPHWSDHVLDNLLFVSLAHNNLSSYGCELKTQQLKAFNLDYNRFEALPSCVLNGSKYTTHLSLRHNQINNLQELSVNKSETEPSAVPQVTHLDLAYNHVEHLRAVKEMSRLLGLDLSHNQLESAPSDSLSLHPHLVWLDLSNNFLEHVTEGLLSSLVSLKHINLSHNSLRSFHVDHEALSPELITLDLRYNSLMYPPFADMAYVVPGKVRVRAAHNPFLCDCNVHPFLQLHNVGNKELRPKPWLSFSNIYRVKDIREQPFVDIDQLICARPLELKGIYLTSLDFKQACPLPRGCPKDCKCELVKKPTPRVSVDCSRSESWTELPEGLPFIPDTPLVLYFNQTGLKRLDHRPYLYRLMELYAADSKLSSVTSDALEALENVSVLDLHNTQLRSLPAVTQNLTLAAVTNISLSGNPWTCGCRDLWMPSWLSQHASSIHDPDQVRCRWTGRLVAELTSADLSCGFLDYVPLTIALSLLTGFILIITSFLAKYKLEILVAFYKNTSLRPFDMYKYDQSRPSLFDVFVSFSEMDYKWVVENLMEHLENRARPYRLCTQLRDFPVGAPLADSVAWAMDNSRCVLLVLSRDLLVNEWSLPDVRTAHLCLLQEAPERVLVIIHGPLDARCLDRELLVHLRRHVYLKSEEPWLWSKLDYALPRPQEGMVMLEPEPRAASIRGGGGRGGCLALAEDSGTVTETGGCFLSEGLAAGDVTPTKVSVPPQVHA